MSRVIDLDQIDVIGESKSAFTQADFKGLAAALVKYSNMYCELIKKRFNDTMAVSSGEGDKSIKPLEIEKDGEKFTIKIEAKEYLKFVSAGVNGVVQSRGSIYSFKNYNISPDMIDSVQRWLEREGKMGTDKSKKPINKKERVRQSLKDATYKRALSVSYMIKRQGIKPRYAIENATIDFEKIVKEHLSAALKIDIINAI